MIVAPRPPYRVAQMLHTEVNLYILLPSSQKLATLNLPQLR